MGSGKLKKIGSAIARGAKATWEWIKNLFRKPRKLLQWGMGFMKGQGGGSGGNGQGFKMPGQGKGQPAPGEAQDGQEDGDGMPMPSPGGKEAGYDDSQLPPPPLKITKDETTEAEKQVHQMVKKLTTKISRRRKKGKKKELPDFRLTFRKSLKTNGAITSINWKNRSITKPRLVVVLDTSGSMAEHAKLLMLLLHGINAELRDYEAFIFSGSLAHVTPLLNKKSFDHTMEKISRVKQWDGGDTNIGGALRTLLDNHHRVLTPKTTFILMTDCYGHGSYREALLLDQVRQRVKQVILMNPKQDALDYGSDYYERTVKPFAQVAQRYYHIPDIYKLSDAVARVVV